MSQDPAIVQDLPPLPEPDGSATRVVGHQQVETMTADVTAEVDAWSRELVEAYARTAVEAAISKEREECAKIADDMDYGLGEVAAAIRARK